MINKPLGKVKKNKNKTTDVGVSRAVGYTDAHG